MKQRLHKAEKNVWRLYEIEKALRNEGQQEGETSYKIFVAEQLNLIVFCLHYRNIALFGLLGLVAVKLLAG